VATENFGDERMLAWCAYCGAEPATRDHAPPKIFLDRPFPDDLPVVGACYDCNNGASRDEAYVAALIECAVTGATGPDGASRPAIRKLLERSPALAAQIAAIRSAGANGPIYTPDMSRVRRVLLKACRAHVLFELNERATEAPTSFEVIPLPLLTKEQLSWFETPADGAVWPEVGSRAMQRLVEGYPGDRPGWVTVQEGRYRYMAAVADGITARILLSEYLACEAVW